MNRMITRNLWIGAVCMATVMSACTGDDDGDNITTPTTPTLEVPDTYSFSRDGATSVSYSGQTERLDQLAAMKSYLLKGDQGETIDAQVLLDMFANTGGNGGGNFSFTSEKDIKSKTFSGDVADYEALMTAAATASIKGGNGTTAASGQAGLLTRGSGSTVLVDENGHEFTQLIEKGLMGAFVMNQILNNYLTDDQVGDAVDNTNLEDGKNYTAMEHHWDEAFGYYGVPVDFTSNWPDARDGEVRFWGNYSNGRDGLTGSNDVIMQAFRGGRAAIVAGMSTERDAARKVLFTEFQRVAAATGIHYINETLTADNDGDRMHVLSEAWAFIDALRYCDLNQRVLTNAEIDQMLGTDIPVNFWDVTTTGLNNAKTTLASKFGLESMQDDL